jgi:hypothetical protein
VDASQRVELTYDQLLELFREQQTWTLTEIAKALRNVGATDQGIGGGSIVGPTDANARVGVRKNSGVTTYLRRRLNLIEGAGVSLTVADDATDEEVDVTVAATAGVGMFNPMQVGGDMIYQSGSAFDPTDDLGNVATTTDGASASAGSTQEGTTPGLMLDGNGATTFALDGIGANAWTKVDLGQDRWVWKLWYNDASDTVTRYGIDGFKVYYSTDDATYTLAAQGAVRTAIQTLTLSVPIFARYWKLVSDGDDDNTWGIRTLEIHAYAGSGVEPTAARVPGNTTATRKFLRQVGDGTESAVPEWDTLQASDYPPMVGDSGTGGTQGAVPAPAAGDAAAGRYLKADGTWAAPPGGTDEAAIHDNVTGEINAVAEKASPVGADVLLIEDSAASYAKKRVQITNLPGGADADAIHDNVAGEIAALTEKASPASADLIIIEDSTTGNAKKKVQIGNLPGGSSTLVLISHQAVGAGGEASVTFDSIPQTYKSLIVEGIGRSSTNAQSTAVQIRCNDDAGNNYDAQAVFAYGVTEDGANAAASGSGWLSNLPAATAAAGAAAQFEFKCKGYAGTTFMKNFVGVWLEKRLNGTPEQLVAAHGVTWRSTSAITKIVLYPAAGNWVEGSQFTLYGVN